MSLPSTGFKVEQEATSYISNGVIGVQMWAGGERAEYEVQVEGDPEWYVLNAMFLPNQVTKVKALFWVQTSFTDVDSIPGFDSTKIQNGKRGFLVDLLHAKAWKDIINSVDVTVVLKEGIIPKNIIDANPDNYEVGDSTFVWSFSNFEPTMEDNIWLQYNSAVKWKTRFDTMEKLYKFIIRRGYDEIIEYVRQLDEG